MSKDQSKDQQKNQAVYETLFRNSHSIMLILDPETGSILDANNAALDFYKYTKKELLEINISKINTLSNAEIANELNLAKDQKRNYFNFQHRLKTGIVKNVEVYTGPIDFKNTKVLYSIIHDISEKIAAQETLKKSESTIRAMINATKSLVYLFDTKGLIVNLNTPGALLFNKSPAEMIGKKFDQYFSENDFTRLSLLVNEISETHDSISYQKDRNGRFFDVNLYPVFNEENKVDMICVFANDITDLKMTEKVFSAIETAGAICHEMNQPLQALLGNMELIQLNSTKDDPNAKLIKNAIKQIRKLGTITKKLTNITRYETKAYLKGTIFDIDRSSK